MKHVDRAISITQGERVGIPCEQCLQTHLPDYLTLRQHDNLPRQFWARLPTDALNPEARMPRDKTMYEHVFESSGYQQTDCAHTSVVSFVSKISRINSITRLHVRYELVDTQIVLTPWCEGPHS